MLSKSAALLRDAATGTDSGLWGSGWEGGALESPGGGGGIQTAR